MYPKYTTKQEVSFIMERKIEIARPPPASSGQVAVLLDLGKDGSELAFLYVRAAF